MPTRTLESCPNQEYRGLVDETRVAPPFWAAMHKAARKEDIDNGGIYDSRSGITVSVQAATDDKPHIVGEFDYDVWRAINVWATANNKPEVHPGFEETGISKELLGEITPVEMDEDRDEIILERITHLSLVSNDKRKEFLQSLESRRLAVKSEAEEAGLLAMPLGYVWVPHDSLVEWVLEKCAELKRKAVKELSKIGFRALCPRCRNWKVEEESPIEGFASHLTEAHGLKVATDMNIWVGGLGVLVQTGEPETRRGTGPAALEHVRPIYRKVENDER